MKEKTIGKLVAFKADCTVAMFDLEITVRRDTKATIVVIHSDNEDLSNPDVNGLFLVELSKWRHSVRIWVRGYRIE